MGEGSAAARARVLAARATLAEELGSLEASARGGGRHPRQGPAQPGQVRRRGGRRRVRRGRRPAPPVPGRAKRAVLGPAGAAPGADAARGDREVPQAPGQGRRRVRGLLEHEFATYLEKSEKERKGRDLQGDPDGRDPRGGAGRSSMRTAKQFGEQFLNPDSDVFREQLEKVRARRDAAQADAEAARAEADALAEADAEIQGL